MKVFSTVQVAARCSAACGKKVGDQFVRECYLELYGLDAMGSGHAPQLTDQQATLIVAYAMEWHGRSRAPKMLEWVKQRDHEIPKLRKAPVPAARAQSPRSGGGSDRISVLEIAVEGLTKEVERLVSGSTKRRYRTPPAQITGSHDGPVDHRRGKIVKLVQSWVRDHIEVIDYASAWSEIYHAFWEQLGQQPPLEWYKSQLRNDTKLDFFEKHEWLGVLYDGLPAILGKLNARYLGPDPRDPQRDLFG